MSTQNYFLMSLLFGLSAFCADRQQLVPVSSSSAGTSADTVDYEQVDARIMALPGNKEARLAIYESLAERAVAHRAMNSVATGATAIGALHNRLAVNEQMCIDVAAQMDGLEDVFRTASTACRTTQDLFVAEKARLETALDSLRESNTSHQAEIARLGEASAHSAQAFSDFTTRDVALSGRIDTLHRDFATTSGELGEIRETVRQLQEELSRVGMSSIGLRLNQMIDAIGGFYSTRPGVAFEIGFAGYLTCYMVRMLSQKFVLLNFLPGLGLIRSFEPVFAAHIAAVAFASVPTFLIPSLDVFNSVLQAYASYVLNGNVKASLVQLVSDQRFIMGATATVVTLLAAYNRKRICRYLPLLRA